MHGDNNADRDGSASGKLPISVTLAVSVDPDLPAMTAAERYMWLAPYVLKCRGVQCRRDGTIVAHCPAHNDRERSLSLRLRYGISCKAGCQYEAMLAAMNVQPPGFAPAADRPN